MEKYKIDDRIFNVKFACDVNKCKGACCTLKGAGGAPILDEEVSLIKSNLRVVKKYLKQENIDALESDGFLEGTQGDYSIKSVSDADCVFSYIEEGIARCSFQKAFDEKETDFRKPVSCHLFPIRIHGAKRNILRFEEISECRDALINGKEKEITLIEFARDSLIREFGETFYNDIKEKFAGENKNI